MDYGFFTDGDDGEHTRGATPFLVVKVKRSMMILEQAWLVQRCVGSGSNQGNGRVAGQIWLTGVDCQFKQ